MNIQTPSLLSLLNEKQVAEITGLSVACLRKWRLQKRGPTFKKVSGRSVRYPAHQLQEWIAAQPAFGEVAQ